jgi:putative DNA primase/helicase
MENTLALACSYRDRGFSPIPVPLGSKNPQLPGWSKLLLTRDELPDFFSDRLSNIGVLLGDASGGVVDIDLDCEEAIELASLFLPETGMIFGRHRRPASHWIYRTTHPGGRHRFNDPEGNSLVEVRANGCMTIFPRSIHPEGDEVRFEVDGEPAKVDFDQLVLSARHLAAASLLLPHWHEGQRHNLALAVAGLLLRGSFSEDDVHRFIDALVLTSGDAEGEDRHQCIVSTARKLKMSEPFSGGPSLASIISEERTKRLFDWLGLSSKEIAVSAVEGAVLPKAYGGPVPESDTANAERFADQNRDRARYSYDLKKWFVWEGCRWVVDGDGEIDRLAARTAKALAVEASDRGDKDALSWAAKSHDLVRLRHMVTLAQSRCSVRLEQFDAEPWKLNCATHVVDLITGELLPQDPANLMRKLAPVVFDPDAECPTFLRFLDRVFDGDQGLIEFVQRAIGYSLTGNTDAQCLFVLVGNGANGKSTLIRVIQDLLGDYAQQTPMETLMVSRSGAIPNDVARLEGARFVAATEAEAGQRLAEAKIKQLTGGDKIPARFLYGEIFEFIPQFKLWLATNRLPEVRGTDDGIWRRFQVIPFNVKIPEAERDPGLAEKLRAELSGILNWAVAGCLEWQKGGLRAPQRVGEATKDYRVGMDVVAQFIEDCCVLEPKTEETAKALYDSYTGWCQSNGEQPISKREFGLRFKQLGYGERHTGKARKWRGIRLKTDDELVELALAPERVPNPSDIDYEAEVDFEDAL